jgi:hypothetical protein
LLLSRLAVQLQSRCKVRLVTGSGAANPPFPPSHDHSVDKVLPAFAEIITSNDFIATS